jgi:hypothetical protein
VRRQTGRERTAAGSASLEVAPEMSVSGDQTYMFSRRADGVVARARRENMSQPGTRGREGQRS